MIKRNTASARFFHGQYFNTQEKYWPESGECISALLIKTVQAEKCCSLRNVKAAMLGMLKPFRCRLPFLESKITVQAKPLFISVKGAILLKTCSVQKVEQIKIHFGFKRSVLKSKLVGWLVGWLGGWVVGSVCRSVGWLVG